MKKSSRILSAILSVALLLTVVLATHADAPKTEMIQFPSGTDTISGFLAVPDKPGVYPGIIAVHEWWGLNDWVKQQAEKLAAQGYVALAVDLYRGKVADNPDLAHELMRGVSPDRATRDLQAAYDLLASQPNVKKDRIGS